MLRAELPPRRGLQRLWLHGEDGSVCLGVLEPRAGQLRLEKRLSRAACAALPRTLLCASLQSEPPLSAPPRRPDGGRTEKGVQSVRLFGQRFVVFRCNDSVPYRD